MEIVQKWVEENHEELSLVANFSGMNRDEVIKYVLDKGLKESMDTVADAVAIEY